MYPLLNSNPQVAFKNNKVEISISCMQVGAINIYSILPFVKDLNSDGLSLSVNVV